MSTYTQWSSEGTLTGTTETVLSTNDTDAMRTITNLRIRNRDSSSITITIELFNLDDPRKIFSWTIFSVALKASGTFEIQTIRIRPGWSLRAKLSADIDDSDVYALWFLEWDDYTA